MRSLIPALVLLGILCFAQAYADPAPDAGTNAPNATAPDNIVSSPGFYSYHAPAGWKVRTLPTGGATMACDMNGPNDCVAMINVWSTPREGSLVIFAQHQLDLEKKVNSESNVQISELQPFTTDSGWQGFMYTDTVTYNGASNVKSHYFFQGHDDIKVIFETTCHGEAASQYAPLFDAAIKTLTQERDISQ